MLILGAAATCWVVFFFMLFMLKGSLLPAGPSQTVWPQRYISCCGSHTQSCTPTQYSTASHTCTQTHSGVHHVFSMYAIFLQHWRWGNIVAAGSSMRTLGGALVRLSRAFVTHVQRLCFLGTLQ